MRTPIAAVAALLLFAACEYNTTNLYQEILPDGGPPPVTSVTSDAGTATQEPADAGGENDMGTGIRAANIMWGRTVQLPSSFDPNNPAVRKLGAEQRLAEIDVTDDKLETAANGFTIYVGSSFLVGLNSVGVRPSGVGPLTAILKWGRGGASLQTIEFDIPVVGTSVGLTDIQGTNGVAFSLPGASFILSARNDANAPVTEDPTTTVNHGVTGFGSALTNVPDVQGFIQRGALNKLGPTLTKTTYLTDMAINVSIAAGAETTIIVPNYARRVRLFRVDQFNNVMPGPIILETFATGLGVSARSGFRTLNANDTGPLEINSGDDQIGLVNMSGVPIFNVKAVFELEL